VKVTQEEDSAILSLAKEAFGSGYVTTDQLRKAVESANQKLITYKINENVVGFTILHILSRIEIQQLLRFTDVQMDTYFGEIQRFGYRKMSCVSSKIRGQGIGEKLFHLGNNWLAKSKAEIALTTYWPSNINTNYQRFLEKNGFNKISELPEFWKLDSLKRNYTCPKCGEPPCICPAILYGNQRLSDTP
jgi:ribosomal protein S18 acetylase RimI-like enzyme